MTGGQGVLRDILRLAAMAVGIALMSGCGAAGPAAGPTAGPVGAAAPTSLPTAAPRAEVAADPSKSVAPKLATLEQELALPESVLEAARREGKVVVISSIDKDVAAKVLEVFRKRYPGIEPQYQEASEEVRTVRTLTEFKAGRNRIDVVMGVGGFLSEYRAAGALSTLSDLPAYANYEPPFRDPQHSWVGVRTQFWGIGYNTEKVKASELPKRWEDLAEPIWRGRIGMGDRPQLWAQQLWKVWGPERTTEFLKRLFANQPQRRKEGLDASANLLGAGEFDMYIPAAPYRIEGLLQRGAPVGWFSPEPLAVAASEMVMLQRSPNPNAAKVFVNWFISREGQATYAKADFAVPGHPALRLEREYLGRFADSILSKQWSMRVPEDEETVLPHARKVWQDLWDS